MSGYQAQVSIGDERGRLAAELAPLLRASAAEVERAIQEQHTRRPKNKRNLVSTLASVAQLAAMLRLFPERERNEWLLGATADATTRRQRALAGELQGITVELCDHLAGPYEVPWDGNWPSAAPRLRGRIPATARPGDVIIGGDGGGGRTALLVIADDDGVTTGKDIPGTWRDPPLEDVWLSTYRRLEQLYPEEIPSSVRRRAEPPPRDT